MMKKDLPSDFNLPIKGDGYDCEKCPSYVNLILSPNQKVKLSLKSWCINNCGTKVVV